MILIGANMGVSVMTREHLLLALILKIPIIFVISKIDICPKNVLEETLKDLKKILKRYRCDREIIELTDTSYNSLIDICSNKF